MIQGRGRARRTCSGACRQAAHRRRQAAEVATLRQAATQPAPAPISPSAPDDTPAGRIRAAGQALAAAAEHAATAAEEGAYRHASLTALQRHYDDLVTAVCAAMPAEPSRNKPAPVAKLPHPAAPAATPEPKPSRNEPATAAPAAAPLPTWDTTAIKPVPQRLPKKRARAVLDAAELVRAPDYRDSHTWILRSGDTLIGYVVPSYGGASRSGRNGWTGLLGGTPGPRCNGRDGAKLDLATRWLQVVTAAPRR